MAWLNPKTLCTTGLAVVCAVAAFRLQSAALSAVSPPDAALLVESPIHDLGDVSQQKEWPVRFLLRNRGRERLVVNELDTACSCGERLKRTIIIPARGTAEVTVILDTRHHSGPVEASSTFTSSDPATPRFQLIARAHVTPVTPAGPPAKLDGR
jgi:hypothetical protein